MKTKRIMVVALVFVMVSVAMKLKAAPSLPSTLPDSLWLVGGEATVRVDEVTYDWYNKVDGYTSQSFWGDSVQTGTDSALDPRGTGQEVLQFSSDTNDEMVLGLTGATNLQNIWDSGATVMIALHATGTSGAQRLFDTTNKGSSGWEIYYEPASGTLGFSQRFSDSSATWAKTVFPSGEAHVITITYDNGSTANTPSFYLDGELLTDLTQYGSNTGTRQADNTNNMFIGARGYSADSEHFVGSIGEIMIYNSVVSDATRQAAENYLINTWIIPEPSTVLLFGLPLVGLLLRRRR